MSALTQLLEQIANSSEIAWNEETYDLALAATLQGADRATYVAKLIENAQQGDTHAILTLGHLQAAEALPMLRAAATGTDPWAATARRALVLYGHGGEVIDAIVNDALHGQARMGRVAAVMDLPKIGGPKAIEALGQALGDPDSAVRMLAWNGLVAALDLEHVMRGPSGKLEKGTRLELFKDFLASDLAAIVRVGAEGMRASLAMLGAGMSPVSLAIAYQPDPAPEVSDAIVQAIVDRDLPYPVEEIAKLKGLARQWAEAGLALRLEAGDERVPEALARLGTRWAAPAMEELAAMESTSPELRAKLTEAVRALTSS
jgi:hypothetical protein